MLTPHSHARLRRVYSVMSSSYRRRIGKASPYSLPALCILLLLYLQRDTLSPRNDRAREEAPIAKVSSNLPQSRTQQTHAIYKYGAFGANMTRLHSLGMSADDTPDEDWAAWNQKSTTLKIMDKYGKDDPTMRAFMHLYEQKGWGKGSGGGSAVQRAAKSIVMLSMLLPALGVTLLLDFPCGDQQWAPHLRQATPALKYIGADIMPGLIQRNIEIFSKQHQVEFILMGLTKTNVFEKIRSQSSVWTSKDVVAVMTRHALEHNTFADSCAFLDSLHRSGATYFIGTNAFGVPTDLPSPITAGYRAIDFYAKPFLFPRGIVSWHETSPVNEKFPDPGKTMMEIWDISSLPAHCTGE